MTPFRRRLLLRFLELFDLGVICISFGLATFAVYYETHAFSWLQFLEMRAKVHNFAFFLLFLVGGHIAFSAFGLYHSRRLSTMGSDVRDILKAAALGSLALWISALAFQFSLFNPLFVAVFFGVTSFLMIASRMTLRFALGTIRRRGRNLRDVLIVGTHPRAVGYAKHLEQRPDFGYRILGFADDEWVGTGEFRQNGYPLVTNLSGFADYLRHHTVDEVVIDLPIKSLYQQASEILAICEEQGIIVRYPPDIFSSKRCQPAAENIEDNPASYNLPQPGGRLAAFGEKDLGHPRLRPVFGSALPRNRWWPRS